MADFTEADLASINAAIKKGVTRFQKGDRMISYQSIDQMKAARDLMKAEINRAAEVTTGEMRPRCYRARTTKGL